MNRVLIESPYKGHAKQQRIHRVYARLCVYDSLCRGEAPFASHLLYTQVLDDNIERQRDKGIKVGLKWGEVANLTVVYMDFGISEGMKIGIRDARTLGRCVLYRSIIAPYADFYDEGTANHFLTGLRLLKRKEKDVRGCLFEVKGEHYIDIGRPYLYTPEDLFLLKLLGFVNENSNFVFRVV